MPYVFFLSYLFFSFFVLDVLKFLMIPFHLFVDVLGQFALFLVIVLIYIFNLPQPTFKWYINSQIAQESYSTILHLSFPSLCASVILFSFTCVTNSTLNCHFCCWYNQSSFKKFYIIGKKTACIYSCSYYFRCFWILFIDCYFHLLSFSFCLKHFA